MPAQQKRDEHSGTTFTPYGRPPAAAANTDRSANS
jgi:hypothetical protein